MDSQKLKVEEEKINLPPLRRMILSKYPTFFKELDSNLKLFAREIRKDLRDEGHVVIGVTGYPGKGKSNDTAICSALIDENYSFDKNICFIPTAKEIEEMYLSLPMYSVLHIDEASKSMHKHKWHERVQQKLNELYDTDREGHFLCTFLLMPRFNNFTENFRNFMIKYWIDIPRKGLMVFYIRDEDKDVRDPWHMDESYKMKKQKWRAKRVFERNIGERISAEQRTECYWFYCEVPAVPKEIWEEYQKLKKQSRIDSKAKEPEIEAENYRDKLERQKFEKWGRVNELQSKGFTQEQIAVAIGLSTKTVQRYVREMKAWKSLQGTPSSSGQKDKNLIFKPLESNEYLEEKAQLDKI
jgi:hypothetical protein